MGLFLVSHTSSCSPVRLTLKLSERERKKSKPIRPPHALRSEREREREKLFLSRVEFFLSFFFCAAAAHTNAKSEKATRRERVRVSSGKKKSHKYFGSETYV